MQLSYYLPGGVVGLGSALPAPATTKYSTRRSDIVLTTPNKQTPWTNWTFPTPPT